MTHEVVMHAPARFFQLGYLRILMNRGRNPTWSSHLNTLGKGKKGILARLSVRIVQKWGLRALLIDSVSDVVLVIPSAEASRHRTKA